jgi:hypothetical protein
MLLMSKFADQKKEVVLEPEEKSEDNNETF